MAGLPRQRRRCPGEETPDLEHRPRGEHPGASEAWLAAAVVALLLLAVCCLTIVGVTALSTF